MIARLKVVNYYRLSGYWFPYRRPDDSFAPGTTFEAIWQHYVFDRRLRLLVMDALERMEVTVRTHVSYHHAHRHGPFAYATDCASLPKLRPDRWADFVCRLVDETHRSRDQFMVAFRDKYGDCHRLPPIWMATEVMSFGTVVSLFIGMEQDLKRRVAAEWAIPDVIFESWLHTLNSVRNICAHHARLWNRRLPTKPMIPGHRKYPEWHDPVPMNNDSVYTVLTICKYALDRIAPQSRWPERVHALLQEFPQIERASMGFPEAWQTSPLWRQAVDGT